MVESKASGGCIQRDGGLDKCIMDIFRLHDLNIIGIAQSGAEDIRMNDEHPLVSTHGLGNEHRTMHSVSNKTLGCFSPCQWPGAFRIRGRFRSMETNQEGVSGPYPPFVQCLDQHV